VSSMLKNKYYFIFYCLVGMLITAWRWPMHKTVINISTS
jgi:hypothetical protein